MESGLHVVGYTYCTNLNNQMHVPVYIMKWINYRPVVKCGTDVRTCKMRTLMRRLKTLVDRLMSGPRLVGRLGSGVQCIG